MKLFLFLVPYFAIGLAISLTAILIETLIMNVGWTRGNTALTFIFAFIATVLLQLLIFPEPISFDWNILIGLYFALMAANRFDLGTTMQRGRWWWKSTTGPQKEKG